MRIKEKYQRSGYFWLPYSSDQKIPGTITISDGGEIELEVIGIFNFEEEIKNPSKDVNISRIIGYVEDDSFVTLDNCFYQKKNLSFKNISKSKIHVNQVFSGVSYDKDEKITFSTVSFSIEGLNEWLDKSGINIQYSKDYRKFDISYIPQEDIVYELENGWKLNILTRCSQDLKNINEVKITEQAYLKISAEEERGFDEFVGILSKLTYLLSFAIDTSVSINEIFATSNKIKTEVTDHKWIQIYYPSIPFSKDALKIDKHRMLFRFTNIQNDAESIINNWLRAYSKIAPSLNLYFSAVTGSYKFLEGRFLALAQALETYHRRTSSDTLYDINEFRSLVAGLVCGCPKEYRKWLLGRIKYGNEINLGKRIQKIIEPFSEYIGNTRERKKLVRSIVNTRNYLTHYSEEIEKESVKGIHMWTLCKKMEAIFQLHILEQLGFKKTEIVVILKNNYKLQQKFKET